MTSKSEVGSIALDFDRRITEMCCSEWNDRVRISWRVGGRGRHTRFWSTGTVSLARDAGPGFFDDQRLVLLDGTANPNILRQFVPQLQVRPEIRVRRNARVIQVRDLGAAATRGKNLQ